MDNKVNLIARILLGLPYVVFGLNGFLGFIQPPPMGPEAMNFMGALMNSGYFIPFLKISEIVAGAMILTGCYRNLGLLISAPITINIVLFHIYLAPGLSNMVLPIVMLLATLHLAREEMDTFGPILQCKKD